MVLLRCSPDGYSLSTRVTTSILMSGKALKEMTREKGKCVERLDTETGESRSIFVYSYQHSGGIAYLWVNESEKYELDEETEFHLAGLEIEGKRNENTVAIKLGPGQTRFIKLVSIADKWKISMGISYVIDEV